MQVFLVRVDEEKVIHVTAIVLDVELFLDEVVKVIQEKEYPAGLVTREQILQSWQAWDAHAAHGNTWTLRQQVRDRVQNILKEEI